MLAFIFDRIKESRDRRMEAIYSPRSLPASSLPSHLSKS